MPKIAIPFKYETLGEGADGAMTYQARWQDVTAYILSTGWTRDTYIDVRSVGYWFEKMGGFPWNSEPPYVYVADEDGSPWIVEWQGPGESERRKYASHDSYGYLYGLRDEG